MVKIIETSPGCVDINCDCGKPITHSNKYGMFCDDECDLEESKEAYKQIKNIVKDTLFFFDKMEKKYNKKIK